MQVGWAERAINPAITDSHPARSIGAAMRSAARLRSRRFRCSVMRNTLPS
ncbi:Uncharacterised protein [Bordetella pertussis]|nr:Uncharacterised protein [Bordetella pertussis]